MSRKIISTNKAVRKSEKPKKLTIAGFAAERGYAKGYIRFKSGPGWVTVGGLDSGKTYEFEISQYCADHCPLRPGLNINSSLRQCCFKI